MLWASIIQSGEKVKKGTLLELGCSTEGAVIYYTLDGSCPCDESTRIRYEAPIVINSDIIVKAMAVKDGMDDSDVVTMVYLLEGTTYGINALTKGNDISVSYENGNLQVDGAKGGSCQVYDYNGNLLISKNSLTNHAIIRLSNTLGYIVRVLPIQGEMIVRKIAVK